MPVLGPIVDESTAERNFAPKPWLKMRGYAPKEVPLGDLPPYSPILAVAK
jgi:hypothetical protein